VRAASQLLQKRGRFIFFWNGDFKKLFFSQGWNIRASFAKLTQVIKSRKMQKCKKCKFFIIQMCLADTGDHFSN
jgi:hypothetical protein